MALTRATRYIVSDRVTGVERRNYEELGALFRINTLVASSKSEIDPEWSVKALNGAQGPKGSEKESTGGLKERVPELRFAPGKKRGHNEALKLHVSAKDILSGGDEPNFGWVPAPATLSPKERRAGMEQAFAWHRQQPKVVMHEYEVDPRTGNRIESTKNNVQIKALGRSIGGLVPGGNLGRRAARALNLIVDADGKFRCPPGTPAANQFTDEFGTNCFTPAASVRRGMGRLRQWFDWHVRNGMVLQGFDVDDPLFEQNFRAMEAAKNMRAPDSVFQAQKQAMEDAIQELSDMLGASKEQAYNEHLWDILDRMKKSDMWGLDFSGLFTGLYGDKVWDDSKSVQDNLSALNQILAEDYRSTLDPNMPDAVAQDMVQTLVERHHEVLGGYLESLLREFRDNPDAARQLKSLDTRTYNPAGSESIDQFWATEAMMIPRSMDDDGFSLSMHINTAALVLKPMFDVDQARTGDDGKIYVLSTDGVGTEAQQWAALQSAFHHNMDLERWRNEYANDLSAARHQSLRAKARHIGYHEFGHLLQYDHAKTMILDEHKNKGVVFAFDYTTGAIEALTDPPSTWTNEQWSMAVDALMQRTLPEDKLADGFPPVGIHAFEGSMLHILSGRYYQDKGEDYWGGEAYTDRGRHRLNVMLLEGMTELRALQKMGVLDSEEIDRQIEWMNGTSDLNPPSPGSIPTPWSPPPAGSGPQVKPPTPPTNPANTAPGGGWPPPAPGRAPTGGLKIQPTSPLDTTVDPNSTDPADVYKWAMDRQYPDGGTTVRRALEKIYGWDSTPIRDLPSDEMDRRFEQLMEDADSIVTKLEAGETLTPQEAARLFFATRGMKQIAADNLKRGRGARSLDDRNVRARQPGKYFPSSSDFFGNYTGSGRADELFYNDSLYEAWGDYISRADNEFSYLRTLRTDVAEWRSNPTNWGKKKIETQKRILTRTEVEALRKTPQVNDWLREERPIRPLMDIASTALPALDAIDANPLEEKVSGYIDGPRGFNPDGFSTIRISSFDEEIDMPDDPSRRKIVLPEGTRAVVDETDPSARRLILPPGTFREVERGDSGARLLVPETQESASDFARRMLEDIDSLPQARLVSDLRSRERARRIFAGRAQDEPRVVTSPFSSDPARRSNQTYRRNSIDNRLAEANVEAFSPDARSRSTRRDVSAPSELNQLSEQLNDSFATGARLADGTEVEWTPEVQEFIARNDGSAIRERVADAAVTWHEGLDKRPRVRRTMDQIEQLLAGIDPRPENNPHLRRVHAELGWPDSAPDDTRPIFGHLVHGVHENIVDEILQGRDRGGYPIRRRGEFFDHSGDTPHGSNLSVFGEIDVVLRPESSMRSAYGLGDLLDNAPSPTLMNEDSRLVIAGNLSVSRRGSGDSALQMHNLLHAGLTGDFRGMQMRGMPGETQQRGISFRGGVQFRTANWNIDASIAGGFNLEDVERVDVPIDSLNWRDMRIDPAELDIASPGSRTFEQLKKSGWSESEIEFLRDSLVAGMVVDLKSASLLRQHRAAVADQRRFVNAGLSVRYTNPDSVNLFAKLDLSSQTSSGMRIGRVRDAEDALRIQMIDEISARQSTLRPQVQQGMASMRKRVMDRAREVVTERVGERATQAATERIRGAGRGLDARTVQNTGIQRVGMNVMNSDVATRVLQRAGLDTDQIDNVRFVGEMAAAFGTSGPYGVGLVLARRGSREGIEFGVRKAIEQGWIDQTQAQRIMRAADTVAPEGLPDAVTEAIGENARRAMDSAAGVRARELAEAAQERVRELSIGDRIDDVFDSVRDRIGRGSAPSAPALSAPSNDPFADPFGGGFRSARAVRSVAPQFTVTDAAEVDGFGSFTTNLAYGEDAVTTDITQRIVDRLGDTFRLSVDDGWGGEPTETALGEMLADYNGRLRAPSGTQIDSIRAAIADADLDDETRKDLNESLDVLVALEKLNAVGRGTKKPPPRRNDPFADDSGPAEEWVAPSPESIQSAIDEVLDSMTESSASRLADEINQFGARQEETRRRREATSQANFNLVEKETTFGDIRRGDDRDALDRSAPVGSATVSRKVNPDYVATEPEEGATRSLDELQRIARDSMVVADDLSKPEHRDELVQLLTKNPAIAQAISNLKKRKESYGTEESSWETQSGESYYGRELMDALIAIRGFDADVARLTEEEIDGLIVGRGFAPLSRGGNPEMARRHIENDGMPIGSGVDGAGVYFAVQGASEKAAVNEHFDASVYAGENGAVMRAAMSPHARTIAPHSVSRMHEEYRLEVQMGQTSNLGEGTNPILALRRELAADPSMADALDALDTMVLSSADGENQNGYGVMAILMGYDGLASFGYGSSDNRFILYNRSSAMVSTATHTAAEYAELRPWEKMLERTAALAQRENIPINLSPEERTEWILRETERLLEAANS